MLVVDTHAWIWWVADPGRLSERAAGAIEAADGVGVSAISCWEVGMLVHGGRITLDRGPADWVRQALGRPGVVALPIGPQVALEAALLDPRAFVGDPADRLIYATARDAGAPLVTRDLRLRDFDPRGTIW